MKPDALAEAVSTLGASIETQTETMSRLGGQLVNSVLLVGTFFVPADGYLVRQFGVAAGAAWIEALDGSLTVSSGPPSSPAPSVGTGVWQVAGSSARIVNLASRQLTIWGTVGDRIGVQVVTHPALGGAGGGVDGGAP